jgi:hypothetical protein
MAFELEAVNSDPVRSGNLKTREPIDHFRVPLLPVQLQLADRILRTGRWLTPGLLVDVDQICERAQGEVAGVLVVNLVIGVHSVMRMADWAVVQFHNVIPTARNQLRGKCKVVVVLVLGVVVAYQHQPTRTGCLVIAFLQGLDGVVELRTEAIGALLELLLVCVNIPTQGL